MVALVQALEEEVDSLLEEEAAVVVPAVATSKKLLTIFKKNTLY